MIIDNIKRPWMRDNQAKKQQGSFYNTQTWKRIRETFLGSEPHISLANIGKAQYRNVYCVACWERGKIVETKVVDHIVQRIKGGTDEHTNLQGLCDYHHNVKRAQEKNNQYGRV